MNEELHFISVGEGLPLTFQHGLTADVRQIIQLLGDLEDVNLLSLDCPGHGLSLVDLNYKPSFNDYTDQVVQLLKSKNIKSSVVGGLSMGAGISMNMAIRYPGIVDGLIILRPAWIDQFSPENLLVLNKAVQYLQIEGGREMFEETPEFQKVASQVPGAASSLLGIFNPSQQQALRYIVEYMVKDRPFSNMEQLTKLSIPTLIMANEDDPLHPMDLAYEIHNSIPGSRFEKITSHYIHGQLYRDNVRTLVHDFLKQFK